MSKPVVAVLGATGKQGSGAVKHLLWDGSFAVRAVTRNPSSDSAKALKEKGVEVVQADLNDVESLTKAFDGAYGVYGMTDYWTAFDDETKHGKNLVDAAKRAGVKHFVWSTLDRSGVPHWDTKADIDDYLKASGVPRTSLYTSWFLENIGSMFFPIKRDPADPEKSLILDAITWTDGPMPAHSSYDIGAYAVAAFKHPEKWINKDMHSITLWVTPREIAQAVEKVLGVKCRVVELSREDFWAQKEKYGPKWQWAEYWENLKWFYENYPNGRGDVAASRALVQHEGFKLKELDDVLRDLGWSIVTEETKSQ